MREHGEVVQRFFDEEAVDAVAVEDEVRAGRAFVADHAGDGICVSSVRIGGLGWYGEPT